jgi:uncharacterized protein YaeQ
MMMRLLAFALNAHERLEFGKGLSATDEPDLWQKDLTGQIVHWIDVGLLDEKRLIRACGKAERVTVYVYGRGVVHWWETSKSRLRRTRNLTVWRVPNEASESLGKLAERTMQLQCIVQEEEVYLSSTKETISLRLDSLRNEK